MISMVEFNVEIAVSNRAACQNCQRKIGKGELKVTYSTPYGNNGNHIVTRSLCAMCGLPRFLDGLRNDIEVLEEYTGKAIKNKGDLFAGLKELQAKAVKEILQSGYIEQPNIPPGVFHIILDECPEELRPEAVKRILRSTRFQENPVRNRRGVLERIAEMSIEDQALREEVDALLAAVELAP